MQITTNYGSNTSMYTGITASAMTWANANHGLITGIHAKSRAGGALYRAPGVSVIAGERKEDMSAARSKGTRWETAIVDYLRANGAPHAERRATAGAKDRGDVAGIPGVVIEAKSHTGMRLAGWLDEAEKERANDAAALAVVWHKRRGKASAGDGYVTMTGSTFVRLLIEAGYIREA